MQCDESFATERWETDVSQVVVQKVADAREVDPLEVETIYETINPDALNRLFQTPTPAGHNDRVEFTLAGCDVVVYGTGTVEVTGPSAMAGQGIDEEGRSVESQPNRMSADDN